MQSSKLDQSLGSLFKDLRQQLGSLLQKEVDLGKAEVNEKVGQVGSGLASLATGAAVLMAGLVVLLIAISYFIQPFLPSDVAQWLAPLIVGAVVVLIGGILVGVGRTNLKPAKLKTSRTVESLRQDTHLAREQLQ